MQAASKFVTDAKRSEMDSNGFTVLESLFTPTEMGFLDQLILVHQKRHADTLLAQGGTSAISRANEITFTDHLAEADPAIMDFVKRPEFVDLTTAFLGPDVDLYWNQAVYKSGGGTKQFPWHQDDGYAAVNPSPYLTIWLAVNDVTVENGCVWVLPGSHKNGLVEHTDTPEGRACYSLDDPNQGVPVPLKAGSAAVFWSLTMHKSGLNVSDGMRKGFVIQYSKKDLKYVPSGDPVPGLTPVVRDGNPVE